MSEAITKFKGVKYGFLSNFYTAPITYNGQSYHNNEAAFQAQKKPEYAWKFQNLSASSAKKLGRRVKLRPDWEEVKDQIMYEICLAKFTQNLDLAVLLLDTGDAELIEGNTWGDTYWGVCNGVGENHLGKILMRIREELKSMQF